MDSWDKGSWWRMTGSNRRPPACKAGALPAELIPPGLLTRLVGLVGFEPTTPALSRRCSNRLSYRPNCLHSCYQSTADKCGCLNFQRHCLTSVHCIQRTEHGDFSVFQKGGDPAAPSDTATLLRLHPSHEPRRGNRPPLRVRLTTSGETRSHGVTGGVYKTRERIHRRS